MLAIAAIGLDVERALVAEGAVQARAVEAGRGAQIVERGRGETVLPEGVHGAGRGPSRPRTRAGGPAGAAARRRKCVIFVPSRIKPLTELYFMRKSTEIARQKIARGENRMDLFFSPLACSMSARIALRRGRRRRQSDRSRSEHEARARDGRGLSRHQPARLRAGAAPRRRNRADRERRRSCNISPTPFPRRNSPRPSPTASAGRDCGNG